MLLGFILFVYIIYTSESFVNILKSRLSFINSCLLTSSLVIFYLDDFKLSNTKFKYVQIFSLIIIPIYIIYNIPYTIIYDMISQAKENDINLHGHVSIDEKAAKNIGQNISTRGSNIGLGATVAGLSSAVAKGVAKSPIPPVQKAGIIMAGGVVGGVIHTVASAINHNNTQSTSISNTEDSTSISNNSTNNLVDFGNNLSPLEILLQCINILSYISLFLLIVLLMQLIYKFYVNDKPKLNWLKYIFSPRICEKAVIWIHKIIKLNKDMSIIYSVIAIIILTVALCTISYTSLELIDNIDKYINVYLEHYKRK